MLQLQSEELLARVTLPAIPAEPTQRLFTEVNRSAIQYHWRELTQQYVLNGMDRPTKNSKVRELPAYESDLTLLMNVPKPLEPTPDFLRQEYLEWLASRSSQYNTLHTSEQIEQLKNGARSLLNNISGPIDQSIGRCAINQELSQSLAEIFGEQDLTLTYETVQDELLASLRRKLQHPIPQETLQQRFGVYDSMFQLAGRLRRSSTYQKEMQRLGGLIEDVTCSYSTNEHIDYSLVLQRESAEIIQDLLQQSRMALLYQEPLEKETPMKTFEEYLQEKVVQNFTSSAMMCQLEEKQEKERRRLKDLLYRDISQQRKEQMQQVGRMSQQPRPNMPVYQKQFVDNNGSLERRRVQLVLPSQQANLPCMTFDKKGKTATIDQREQPLYLPPPESRRLSDIKSAGDFEDEDLFLPIESYGRHKKQDSNRLVAVCPKQLPKAQQTFSNVPKQEPIRLKPKYSIPMMQPLKPSPQYHPKKPSPVFKVVKQMSHQNPKLNFRLPHQEKRPEQSPKQLEDYRQKKQPTNESQGRFYPYSVSTAVFTADDCYIVYYFTSISEKDLCLTFLLDRIKTQVNSVRILVTPQQLQREEDKLFKYVAALALLGAQVRVESSNRTCESYNRKEFWVARAVSSATGRPLQSTIRRLREARWPDDSVDARR